MREFELGIVVLGVSAALFGGWLERAGPRKAGLVAALCWSGGFLIAAYAVYIHQLWLFWLGLGVIGGIGLGLGYISPVSTLIKWFPDRRGLAAGVTAAGFGTGSALTIIPISMMIAGNGFQSAFFTFGLIQGIAICLCSLYLKAPPKAAADKSFPVAGVADQGPTRRSYSPLQMAKTRTFWLMYLMFVMMASGGLMATAQLASIAKDFGVADVPVSFIGVTLPALTFALSIDRLLNGATRPFFGWVSDRIGREPTMFIAFGLEGLAILALSKFGHTPGRFVLLTGLVFFAWGEIYSLFPATCADTFGTKFAAANAGLLYTAKGTASLLVPFSSLLTDATGSWHMVFWIAAAMNVLTALLAVLALRPLRQRLMAARG